MWKGRSLECEKKILKIFWKWVSFYFLPKHGFSK